MPENRQIVSWLDDAADDLLAAELLLTQPELVRSGNRRAANLLYSAAEKLVKAVRLHRGLRLTKEHRLELCIDGDPLGGEPMPLPPADAWRAVLTPLVPLSAYATAFRYPSPAGRRESGPDVDAARGWVDMLRPLIDRARRELR